MYLIYGLMGLRVSKGMGKARDLWPVAIAPSRLAVSRGKEGVSTCHVPRT